MSRFFTRHLHRLGNSIQVQVPTDSDGYTGRACPKQDCKGYFKIMLGTGILEEEVPCHCPYCGFSDSQNNFFTQQQIDYATSVAKKRILEAFRKDLKQLEFDHKPPKGSLGMSLSMKLKPGRSIPIRHFRESKLQTYVTCSNCTLKYAVYGIFAYCPDCGQHNSLQMFEANLDIIEKIINSSEYSNEIAEKITEIALERCIAEFDGFGNNLLSVISTESKFNIPSLSINFQNISSCKEKIADSLNVDISQNIPPEQWSQLLVLFQKRHLLAHKSGVIDQHYITRSGDKNAVVGRKINVTMADVELVIRSLRIIARDLSIFFLESN